MNIRLLASLFAVLMLGLSARAQTMVSNTTYSGQTETVLGPGTVTTSGTVTVTSGSNVKFFATSSVTLNAGFSCSGSAFQVNVGTLPPSFTPSAGAYSSAQAVTITDSVSGAAIYYTTDGSIPTTASHLYTTPVSIPATTVLRAIAVLGGSSSLVASGYYAVNLPPASAPTVSIAPGTYTGTQTVSMTGTGSGSIYYTTDGSTPTATNGTLYTGPISISSTTVLKVIATGNGNSNSSVTGGIYTISNSPASALNILYDFTASNSVGINPVASLAQGSDGNFYGTAEAGSSSDGTVFQMTLANTLTSLALFNGANGVAPHGSLVQTSDGNFYGTTFYGGSNNMGTVFKMTPAGVLTTLVSFAGANGAYPQSALVQGSDGNFYGTTFYGGGDNAGTIFKLIPAGSLTTLVSFTGPNGALPAGALVQGSDGNFYGTTEGGGSSKDGTIFKLTPTGSLTTLISFTGANGANPTGALVQGGDGNFYGTTEIGGGNANGTIFQLTPTGVLSILVSFDGANGANPVAGLIQGVDGNLYGTTPSGGSANDGVIFQLMETSLPSTTLTPATTNVYFGQSATLTATTDALEANLVNQIIDYQAPGSSSWVSGTTISGASWSGAPTDSNTLSWTVPASLLNATGTWKFRASGSDGTHVSAYAYASVVVSKTTPNVSQWSDQTFTNANTVTAADLNAIFGNPYSGGVTNPTGTVIYTVISSTSPQVPPGTTIAVGTVLPPGTYTIGVTYSGDNNYNGYTAPPVTWTEQLGTTFQYDANGRLISVQQASAAPGGGSTTTTYHLDPETNVNSVNSTTH